MSTIPFTYIDTAAGLQSCLRSILSARKVAIQTKINPHTPLLYVDIEGNDLCRYGTISLIQIYVPLVNTTFVLDVLVLGKEAFTTSVIEEEEMTLKSLLESPEIVKCFFDGMVVFLEVGCDSLMGLSS